MKEIDNMEEVKKMKPDTKEVALQKWAENYPVWSIELGGLSPSYEQAMQILVWEILTHWKGLSTVNGDGTEYTKEYSDFAKDQADRIENYGLSAMQFGAAKSLASHFIEKGYESVMSEIPDDRKIMVNRNFPTLRLNTETYQ